MRNHLKLAVFVMLLVLCRRVEKELGVPAANILISATHTHSVPFIGRLPFPNSAPAIFSTPPTHISLGLEPLLW